jgi:hypothetical protein
MEEGRKKKRKKKGRPYLPIMESLICASPRVMRRPCACAGLSPSRTLPTLLRPGEICEREGSSEFLFVHIQAVYGKTDSAQRADHARYVCRSRQCRVGSAGGRLPDWQYSCERFVQVLLFFPYFDCFHTVAFSVVVRTGRHLSQVKRPHISRSGCAFPIRAVQNRLGLKGIYTRAGGPVNGGPVF